MMLLADKLHKCEYISLFVRGISYSDYRPRPVTSSTSAWQSDRTRSLTAFALVADYNFMQCSARSVITSCATHQPFEVVPPRRKLCVKLIREVVN